MTAPWQFSFLARRLERNVLCLQTLKPRRNATRTVRGYNARRDGLRPTAVMDKKLLSGLIALLIVVGKAPAQTSANADAILSQATRVFGTALNEEHKVFPLNDTYVVWLIQDTKGDLIEVDVGPKSYYTTEFPRAGKPSEPEFLAQTEYNETIRKIAELKEVGRLRTRHEVTVLSGFGPLNTDIFEHAAVDRIVSSNDADRVKKLTLYFFQDVSGSPKDIAPFSAEPMVCLVNQWYYVRRDALKRIQLGKWQNLLAAGPNMHTYGCLRTTVLHDADGFTIEEPQNVTIIYSQPFIVRELAGQVLLGETPLDAVNVEFKRLGSKKVLRLKTDERGAFRIQHVRDGKNKFKVSKDGFKALSGTVIVDRRAEKADLSFEMYVGT